MYIHHGRSSLCAALIAVAATNTASALDLEELIITARHDTRTIDVSEALSISPDAAELLRDAPGANVATNGPITGIPQYRGLFGPRISVSLDGSLLAPAGPNWMDPPLSYAVTAQLEALEVYRGIAPVSVAQESVGGAIDARTRRMAFSADDQIRTEGRLVGSAQSVNTGYQIDADLQAANDQHRVKVAAMLQDGDDAEFPGGTILPSRYERQRYDLGYGFRWGDHNIQLDYGYNDTGSSGTPALPMDIDYFEGDLYKLAYRFEPKQGAQLSASIYASELDHGMSNYALRPSPVSPESWRRNIADTRNSGFKLEASLADDTGGWRAGIDGFDENHNSNIDNPNNPMFFVVNFNGAERSLVGGYLEREQNISEHIRVELGVRANRVRSNAGEVNGTPAMMMPPAQALRDAFNAADRDQTDNNVDLVAKLNYAVNDALSLYMGLAQKQRAPSYQERYLWLPLEATGGLADGQLYIGDINLDSEEAHNLEFGLDFAGDRITMHPRVFYYRINDYIQGTALEGTHPATMMVRMMNNMNGTNRADPLQFSNVDAALYGFDMDWAWRLSERMELSGLVNYVRGERKDIDDNLYRIAPPNASLRLSYAGDNWSTMLETVGYSAQNNVSATNRELESSGYAIVNLRGTWQVSPSLQLAIGIDNVFDREYAPHLSGYNRVRNPDIATGERLPAMGTNLFGRMVYTF
ncbi:TonB-dependent receptor [Congregibacter litoralis]|uniref:Outer membrane receptor protein, mostly Fe transport n=1 Tax=Congregibacter litoralis KT71 TaxID=314285 RepID=A4A978_9GAMM|nr:TonB-dependent receptor [Congregibacter litoralis]EAQ97620.1 Outer membrane receptor protein, mostly Fe transport [Congregibacter litoralis KT71]